MSMTWLVFAAVLCGALLHAAWNAMIKSAGDKNFDTALLRLTGSAIGVPLMLMAGVPAEAAWPYLALSMFIHTGYYAALSGAYTHGDLSVTYPIMRGSAPALTAIGAVLVIHEPMSTLGMLGIFTVSAGVILLGWAARQSDVRALRFALANAVFIALYTLVDAMGVRASGNALQYVLTLFAIEGWPFTLWMLYRHRTRFIAHARVRWTYATAGALASMASYGITLWAMTQAPVATVAALREVSVLFAAVLGAWFLKEPFTARRVVGALTVVAGVMALRFG